MKPKKTPEAKEVKEKKKEPFSFMKTFSIKNKIKERTQPAKTFIINMELNNGMHDTFMISTDTKEFKYMKGTYIIDTELKYYNLQSKCYMLDYHQSCTLPIKREIPTKEIEKAVMAAGLIECETSMNPSTLENFIVSKVAEGIMKGGSELDDFFKQIKMLLVITCVASLATVILLLMKSGLIGQTGLI